MTHSLFSEKRMNTTMKMDERIRVRTDKDHRQLYTELKGLLVKDFHELFLLCACTGFRNHCRKHLEHSAEERFWSSTITPDEWCMYYSMILSDNNMQFTTIQEDKTVLCQIEEYANGGLNYLIQNVFTGFLIERDGLFQIDKTVSKDIPRRVMQYIFETISN
jgi:hypothetical protein